jgi:hypothetical protein
MCMSVTIDGFGLVARLIAHLLHSLLHFTNHYRTQTNVFSLSHSPQVISWQRLLTVEVLELLLLLHYPIALNCTD